MGGIEQYTENGRMVMNDHNTQNESRLDRRLNYVIMAQQRYAPELAEEETSEPNAHYEDETSWLGQEGDDGGNGDNSETRDYQMDLDEASLVNSDNDDNMDLEYLDG